MNTIISSWQSKGKIEKFFYRFIHGSTKQRQSECTRIDSGVAKGKLIFGRERRKEKMCRYAEKRREGDDLKTHCLAHEGEPYPVSDDFVRTKESGFYELGKCLEKKCCHGDYWKCTIFWGEAPEGKLLFSILLGAFLWLAAFPFIILKGIDNSLIWNLVSLIGIIASIFGSLRNKVILKKLKSLQSKKYEVKK